jgi:hypothetical protein
MKKEVKKEIRILGIDDSPYKRKDKEVLVIGTIYRGGSYLDGLLSFKIKRDGRDATDKIIRTINKTKHKDQLQLVMIDGITLAGFNLVDIQEVNKKTKLPAIVIIRKRPKMKKFLLALKKINKKGKRIIEKAGKVCKVEVNGKNIFVQLAGISLKRAKSILQLTCLHSAIPEPIRVAHLIASGIYYGESKGRA